MTFETVRPATVAFAVVAAALLSFAAPVAQA